MKGSCLLELFGFNLSPAAIRELFNAADLHHDGVIEYGEFVPVATEVADWHEGKECTCSQGCTNEESSHAKPW